MQTQQTENVNTMRTILTDKNFAAEVLEATELVLVEFGAEWCGACHMLAPVLEQLSADFQGQIKITRVDIEAQPRNAAKYGVRDLPTLVLFKHGQVVDQIAGLVPKSIIAAKLREWLQ